ncbi:flagellar export chaperone FlgN [Pseudoduganella chitinolytica]|uniref:Flagellar export chaperone FlgN n=1 Tax=Pseudoduganella chitinolytica TaxID=34070 RepID=A0ABY8BFH6_9BURK|nr:flagellar export chaperone FlgN [Pseudoduganella chitinolytica]WEF34053.1 flagellar export chaperone FlgN [Pseudoduganella chitinolytica]
MNGKTAQAPLSRQDAMKQLLQGLVDDKAGYAELLQLLDEQFDAAIRHQRERLGSIASAIAALVDTLEARRARRVELATLLAGPAPSMAAIFALLRPESRVRVQDDWAELEQMVSAAKAGGKRNGDLLAEQYTIMQRVLHGEDQLYEPV